MPVDSLTSGQEAAPAPAKAQGSGYYDAREEADVVVVREAKQILSSASLLKSLELCEAAISQNVFHEKHLLYRDIPDIKNILEAFAAGTAASTVAFASNADELMDAIAPPKRQAEVSMVISQMLKEEPHKRPNAASILKSNFNKTFDAATEARLDEELN